MSVTSGFEEKTNEDKCANFPIAFFTSSFTFSYEHAGGEVDASLVF